MSTKFVMFKRANGNTPILINRDHIRTALESGSDQVTLVFEHGKMVVVKTWGKPQIRLGGAHELRAHVDLTSSSRVPDTSLATPGTPEPAPWLKPRVALRRKTCWSRKYGDREI